MRTMLIIMLAVLAVPTAAVAGWIGGATARYDAETRKCMNCHSKGGADFHNRAANHPVGTSYRDAAKRDPSLKPYRELDSRLRLTFTGRMKCTTCHIPFVEETHANTGTTLLVLGNSKSELCQECHRGM